MTVVMTGRTCSYSGCRKPYSPKQEYQRFCSPKCRARGWMEKKINQEAARLVKGKRAKVQQG